MIIQGDCLQVMHYMSQSVDVICTSPPYNLDIKYHTYQDNKPRQVYLEWMRAVSAEMRYALKDNGSLFLNIGSTNIDPWIEADVAAVFRETWFLQNRIVWVKSISIGDDTVGHFKPITSQRFLNNNHETIFHFTKTGNVSVDRLAIGVPFKDKSNIARRGHTEDKRCAGNVRFIPYDTVKSKAGKFDHPAGFPVALPEFCLKMHGGVGTVLDPFMGTGTTLVAAKRLGWESIGIEIDPEYAKTATERLHE